MKIGNIRMKNPVMLASGTYEYNEATKKLIDIKKLGAVVTKTITLKPTKGNPPPRTCETRGGMLNAIGLQNKGVDHFLKKTLPELKKLRVPIIASIAGKSVKEIEELAGRLDGANRIAGIELNLSCPNTGNTRLIAQSTKATHAFVSAAKRMTKKTVIAKLSPNVTDIAEIAASAESAGADAISLINTLLGMAIDIERKRPILGNVTGGLSGPAIKPVALRMVWRVSRSVSVPVIGMGGIATGADAIEFIIAGASAVQIGTASFVNPNAGSEVIEEIKDYLVTNKMRTITSLIGAFKG